MTLQIQNIYYDHSHESNVYERGVYSIDSVTKRIHVHDGVTPNGIGTPITADLSQFATKNFSNVTQEDITNMLTNFGVMNMNNASPITTAQKDNVYSKLYMAPLQSTANLPASNFLTINSTTREIGTRNTSEVPTFFPCLDTSQTSYARANNVPYAASRHCMVTIGWHRGDTLGGGPRLWIDGVSVWAMDTFYAKGFIGLGGINSHFVAAGSTYQVTGAGVNSIVEYGIKKLVF